MMSKLLESALEGKPSSSTTPGSLSMNAKTALSKKVVQFIFPFDEFLECYIIDLLFAIIPKLAFTFLGYNCNI
jgi:hypothetical protein